VLNAESLVRLQVEASIQAVHHLKTQQRVLLQVRAHLDHHLLPQVMYLLEVLAHHHQERQALHHLLDHPVARVPPHQENLLEALADRRVPHLLEVHLEALVLHHPAAHQKALVRHPPLVHLEALVRHLLVVHLEALVWLHLHLQVLHHQVVRAVFHRVVLVVLRVNLQVLDLLVARARLPLVVHHRVQVHHQVMLHQEDLVLRRVRHRVMFLPHTQQSLWRLLIAMV